MDSLKDITTPEDVKLMVDRFYEKVNKDEMLSPVFNGFAHVDWEEHLPKMYKFWNSIILGTEEYRGRPFPPHSVLPIEQKHFERWVSLFKQNIDENFKGQLAELVKQRAESIAQVFQYKLGLIK